MSKPNSANFFSPKNRRLLIQPVEQSSQTDSGVLLPDDYTENKHTLAKVSDVSTDCNLFSATFLQPGLHVVVDTHMIETIKVNGQKFQTVMENYVIGTMEL